LHDSDELCDGRLKRAQQLGEEHFAGRQIRQLLDLVSIDYATFDDTANHVDLQSGRPDELVDEPRR
jgi:hypothetical protein